MQEGREQGEIKPTRRLSGTRAITLVCLLTIVTSACRYQLSAVGGDQSGLLLPDVQSGFSEEGVFQIEALSRSYFALNEQGALIPQRRQGKKYYKVGEARYRFVRRLSIANTAIVVMDPWEDVGSDFLNRHYRPILKKAVIPLVRQGLALDIRVIVLTNDPAKNPADYASAIDPELQQMVDEGQVALFYHQDFTAQSFTKLLKDQSVDTLIYSGFASNVCVIGRELGLVPMQNKGFRIFFVPEASAAVEFANSWKTGEVHEDTTRLISQWLAELIDLNDFLKLSKPIAVQR